MKEVTLKDGNIPCSEGNILYLNSVSVSILVVILLYCFARWELWVASTWDLPAFFIKTA